ncbi:hypothetical protein SPRG_19567 [Saprolegnia parasitica CBS 223.65]|uniref:DDE-1 domain-containing protein n=1 Tax=Saprolegnia parasitica (strain CBS 223.65) TaxID=695850 RepID=A0A067CWU8_SAPPC|nr:hypothetical protein SPRG_19567 [Saprolegnia parasitica CBS 223.65]KDO31021.1 hypothetical protein SPRG_19567 [Saprolegnia parasitica CBS 223.65]|eukprot:XP_012198302.1 hypothetical protein SPRG_19567 [Saprolegnia parasitica CBS 223.65]
MFDASRLSQAEYCRRTRLSRKALYNMITPKGRAMLAAAHGKLSYKRKRSSGGGRKEIIPFANELLTYMKDLRRSRRCLAVAIMVEYIKEHQTAWLDKYENEYKDKTIANLTRLCSRFATRHCFVRKSITTAKMSEEEMAKKKAELSQDFWGKYADKDPSLVLNCDETGIFYDTPLPRFKLKSDLYPLPPNTTSTCQPLDVGVMGPFKAKLRALWLRDTKKYTTPAEKRMAVIKRAIAAWDDISEDAIKSAFAKAIPKHVV